MASSADKNELAPDQSSVTIVADKKDFKKFIEFPYMHYKGAQNWIPPLRMQQKFWM